jgi:hypothetical protein
MLSKMVLILKILLVTTSSVVPCQLLHKLKSPFFGVLITIPSFHSIGNISLYQISWNRGKSISAAFEESSFNILAVLVCSPMVFLHISVVGLNMSLPFPLPHYEGN